MTAPTHGAYLASINAALPSGRCIDTLHVRALDAAGQPAGPVLDVIDVPSDESEGPYDAALGTAGWTVLGRGDTGHGDPQVAGPGALTLLRKDRA